MAYEEQIQDENLVAQLGTENRILDDDQYDYQILSVIRPSTETPDTFKSALYFSTVNTIIKAKHQERPITFMEAIMQNALRLNVSVGGRGRRDLIYGEQVKRGIGVGMNREIPKPTMWDKLFRKQVVDQYERQEAERLELE